ncbi:NfeD family protein [Halalkalibaculum sp. DA3122]|uniref:NfeD family protein n=1 Tax=unclassified Halalkalibaculum TaxID=2964617 RepID=UPI003754361A
MDGELLTWIFMIGGVLLMVIEMVVPGGVSFFLGLSGILVGGLRLLGFLTEPTTAVLAWLLSSIGLILLMRPVMKKYWGGESSFKLADEDFEAIDEVVEVVEPVNPDDNSGRIRYQGISWQARTLEGKLHKGQKARIKFRDNVTWIVEPLDEIQDGNMS